MQNPKDISPRERALNNQMKRKKRALRQSRRKAFAAYASRVLLLAVVSTVIFASVTILLVLRDFHDAPEKYTYSLTVKKDGERQNLSTGLTTRENTAYISLKEFAEILGYRLMGDVHTMSAVFENGDVASFLVDTDMVSLNGTKRFMGQKSYFSGIDGDTFVPLYFFDDTFQGITLSGEKNGRKIDYTLEISSDFTLAFSQNLPNTLPDTSHIWVATPPDSQFIADLSAYEKYMDPENPEEFLILVGTTSPLAKDYVPDDLIDVVDTRKDRAPGKMREYAEKALEAMFIEMRANGFTDVSVTSAYRSYEYQEQLFNNYLSQQRQYYDEDTAYAKTMTFSALPGTSEHQSGLCADLHNLPSASQAFAAEKVYKWLYAHCADFGFILRFPKDKQDITGIIFEPWHYRYVGRYHAKKIMQSGLCLEEYLEENHF